MDISPGMLLLAVIGAVMGFIVSKSMDPGAFWIIASTLGCGGAGLIIGSISANN